MPNREELLERQAAATYYVGMSYTPADAHTLSVTVICNTSPDTTTTFDYYYTITGSTLTLTQAGSSDVLTLTVESTDGRRVGKVLVVRDATDGDGGSAGESALPASHVGEVTRIDEEPAASSPHADALRAAGFTTSFAPMTSATSAFWNSPLISSISFSLS